MDDRADTFYAIIENYIETCNIITSLAIHATELLYILRDESHDPRICSYIERLEAMSTNLSDTMDKHEELARKLRDDSD